MQAAISSTFTPEFLNKLELLKISAQRAFLGLRQGAYRSLKRGHGMEFSDYRKYELGDNPRHIDWGLYARSDRIYVKRFVEEQDICVYIMLDTSSSMILPESPSKWNRAKDLALAFSYISLMQQNSVSISALGNVDTPRYYGGKTIHSISAQLEKIQAVSERDLRGLIQKSAGRLKFPGILIFISDFLMPLENIQSCFNLLRAKNLEISAIQVLGDLDLEPWREGDRAYMLDSESGAEAYLDMDSKFKIGYTQELDLHNYKLQSWFSSNKISSAQYLPQQDMFDFMLVELTRIGLLE